MFFISPFYSIIAEKSKKPIVIKKRKYINEKRLHSQNAVFLVGEGGFEPPKLEATDLQSAPFGHSGTLPNMKPANPLAGFWSW